MAVRGYQVITTALMCGLGVYTGKSHNDSSVHFLVRILTANRNQVL